MAAPGAGQQQPGAQDFKEEPGSRVMVHERADSKSELDKLFAVVDPGGGAGPGAGGRPLQVPLKMRNLPASFWHPGPIGTKSPGQSHSRENSLDNSAPFSPGPAPTPPPNHHTRTSSCPPALGQLDRGAGAQHQVQALPSHLSPGGHLRHQSFDVSGVNEDVLGPLPPGWEKSQTPQGQIYFLNHNNKSTQWEDPRKAMYNSKIRQLSAAGGVGGAVSPRNAASPIPGQGGLPPAGPQPPQLAGAGAGQQAALGPLPEGWEIKYTEAGEAYYVDHVSKKTQWQDPRSTQVHAKTMQQVQHLKLQWNMMESRKKQLHLAGRAGAAAGRPRSASHENVAMTQAQEMMMRHTLNEGGPPHTNIVDPFLAGQPGETHNRQESADSGLGMGSNFNLGSIPEDMGLENMDTADLDTTLTDTNQQPGSGAAVPGTMETDQLISSLPELAEPLTEDIMQTILSTKEQQQQQQQDPLWL